MDDPSDPGLGQSMAAADPPATRQARLLPGQDLAAAAGPGRGRREERGLRAAGERAGPGGLRVAPAGDLGGGGGEAMLCEARLIEGLSDQEVRALFNRARDEDYDAIAKEARSIGAELGDEPPPERRAEVKGQLTRLKNRLAQVVGIDFFGADRRVPLEGLLAELEDRVAEPAAETSRAASSELMLCEYAGPDLGDATRVSRRPHRLGLADPSVHRPGGPVQVRPGQGLHAGPGRAPLRHVRGRVHARGRPLHLRGPAGAGRPGRSRAPRPSPRSCTTSTSRTASSAATRQRASRP